MSHAVFRRPTTAGPLAFDSSGSRSEPCQLANQVEIYFSVVQRKVVSPNDFHSLSEVESRLLDFQQHYEQIATPFEWKFTKNDLNALLERIAAHDNADPALAA